MTAVYIDFSSLDGSKLNLDSFQRQYAIPIQSIKAETVSFADGSEEKLHTVFDGMKWCFL